MPDAAASGRRRAPSTSTTTCSARRSTARWCTRSSWPSWPRAARARTPPRPAAWSPAAAPSRGARRARAAPAPARRARRSGPAAAPSSGPSPRHYVVKVNRKARRAALRCRAVGARRARIAATCWTPAAFDAPSTKQAAELLDGHRGGSVLVALGDDELTAAKSFRNLARVSVLHVDDVGVADLVGAATLVAHPGGAGRA